MTRRPLATSQCALFDHSPNLIAVLDQDGALRYLNGAAIRHVPGFDGSAAIGQIAFDQYPPLYGLDARTLFEQVCAEQAAISAERFDATTDRWYRLSMYPADHGAIAVVEEITEAKRLMRQLRRSEESLRLAYQCADIGTLHFDLTTRRCQVSEEFLRYLGIHGNGDGLQEHAIEELAPFIHADDRVLAMRSWQQTRETGIKQVVRHRIVRADGAIRHMSSTLMLAPDATGAMTQVIATTRDVTDSVHAARERARIDARQHRAQRHENLGMLAGGIAHDFNNLLVGILGNASLATEELDGAHPVRPLLQRISTAAEHAATLTRKLLTYAGKGPVDATPTELSALVRSMRPLLRSQIHRGVQLRMALHPALPEVALDQQQIRQLTMNLVQNASDFLGAAAGIITIETGLVDLTADDLAECAPGSTARPGSFVCLDISDSLSVLDDATRDRLFEPFFSPRFTEHGLGLAGTLGIVHSHHGAVRVRSRHDGGTAVTAYFPTVGFTVVPTPIPTARHNGQRHALVIDDDETVRRVSCTLLRRRGFHVTEAADGMEGIERFGAAPAQFHIVLLDLAMPGMNGHDTLMELRRIRADVRVLIVSGYDETDVMYTLGRAPAAGFLAKPFTASAMYEALAGVLGDPSILTAVPG